MAVAAIARFATLDEQSFWYDEAVTVGLSRWISATCSTGSPTASPRRRSTTLVAWLWAKVFGTGEVGLRSLSALCGTAFIPVIYAIGARAAGVRVGLVAAALAALNPLLVWYSQEARAYALLRPPRRAVVPVLHPAADRRPAPAHARAVGGRVGARARDALLRRVPRRDRGRLAARDRGEPAADRRRGGSAGRRRAGAASAAAPPALARPRRLHRQTPRSATGSRARRSSSSSASTRPARWSPRSWPACSSRSPSGSSGRRGDDRERRAALIGHRRRRYHCWRPRLCSR